MLGFQISYFPFGIKRERQLVKEREVNIAYCWFLDISLTEEMIDASTLNQNRLRRFNDTNIDMLNSDVAQLREVR